MKGDFVFSKGSFFHGTKAALKIGDLLITGRIIMMIENPSMSTLPGHWTLRFGGRNWQREAVRKKYTLLNQRESLKMILILQIKNFQGILRNLIGPNIR